MFGTSPRHGHEPMHELSSYIFRVTWQKAINCDIKYNPDKGCRSKTSFSAAHKNDAGKTQHVFLPYENGFTMKAACHALKGLRLFLLRGESLPSSFGAG